MKVTSITCHLLTGRWTGDRSFGQHLHATAFVQIDTDDAEPGLGVRFDRELLEKYRFVAGSGERL